MGLQLGQQGPDLVCLVLHLFHMIHDLHSRPFGHGNDSAQLILGVFNLYSGLVKVSPLYFTIFDRQGHNG